jgi:hypothetical protein
MAEMVSDTIVLHMDCLLKKYFLIINLFQIT